MDDPPFNDPAYHKQLAVNNLATCVYLPGLFLWLRYTDTLYTIGNYQNTNVPIFLFVAEIVKYLACWHFFKKVDKKTSKALNPQSSINIYKFLKSTVVLIGSVMFCYIITILLGVPFISKHTETLTFSLIIVILAALPCCLHLGPYSIPNFILSLTYYDGTETCEKFLSILRFTIFGAWVSAIVIPLDWDKPYQRWPIPCILGSFAGCFCANLYLAVMYYWGCTVKQQKGKRLKV